VGSLLHTETVLQRPGFTTPRANRAGDPA